MSKFLCLMPVYNHQQYLIESAVQCFMDQDIADATLLIGDDRPLAKQLDYSGTGNVIVYRMPERAKHTLDKYNQMLTQANRLGIEYDSIALWDDDDLYLPHHLSTASKALMAGSWYTWPQWTFNAYKDDVNKTETGGRFWASMTIRRSTLERIGGFSDDGTISFDQKFMHHLQNKLGYPAEPSNPSYIYRWIGTGDVHVSAMTGDPNDTSWWNKVVAADCVGPLKPQYDPHAKLVIQQAVNWVD